MRNANREKALEKNFNHHLKSFVKSPSQTLNKGSIFYKLIDFGVDKSDTNQNLCGINKDDKNQTQKFKKKTILKEENVKNDSKTSSNSVESNVHLKLQDHGRNNMKTDRLDDYQASFHYSEKVKSIIDQSKVKTTANEPFTAKRSNLNTLNLLDNINNDRINKMECSSADSRVTGGGCYKNTEKYILNTNNSSNVLNNDWINKKVAKETNASRKVSFKVRHPSSGHRKNNNGITITTLTGSKVTALTQKFNNLIKENDSMLKEPWFAKVVDTIQNSRHKTDSNNSTPTSTLPSGLNVKIITNSKVPLKRKISVKSKSTSNTSLDRISKSESPSQIKVTRTKSDSVNKKKNNGKKKEVYKMIDFTHEKLYITNRNDKTNELTELYEAKKIKSNVKRKPSFKTSPTRHSVDVKAAIKQFEMRKSTITPSSIETPVQMIEKNVDVKGNAKLRDKKSLQSSLNKDDDFVAKPKVPEKKMHVSKTKNIVVKDGIPKIKLFQKAVSIEHDIGKDGMTNLERIDSKEKIKSSTESLQSLNASSKKEFIYDKINFRHSFENKLKLPLNVSDGSIDLDLKVNPLNQEKSPNLDLGVNPSHKGTSPDLDLGVNLLQKGTSPDLDIEVYPSYKETSSDLELGVDPSHKRTSIDFDKDSSVTDKNPEILSSLTDDEKLYQEVSARIKPNDSFLWRSNSKNELITYKDYEIRCIDLKEETENVYDFVGLPVKIPDSENKEEKSLEEQIVCPEFEAFIKKADELLDIKKREIAEDLKKEKDVFPSPEICNEAVNLYVGKDSEDSDLDVIEAINIQTVNHMEKIKPMLIDEGYEPFDLYTNKLILDIPKPIPEVTQKNKYNNKSNCPLPEVPQQDNDHLYQCLFESTSHYEKDNVSVHTYEYCQCKVEDTKKTASEIDGGYEYCKAPKENTTFSAKDASLINNQEHQRDGYSSPKNDLYECLPPKSLNESIYESIPPKSLIESLHNTHFNSNIGNYGENGINYDECSCDENIYDTIKQSDTVSVSNCYESIPGSPHSVIRMRQKPHKYNPRLLLGNGTPYDAISNFSHSCSGSTISSENKTNSIYGQRSIMSYERSETIVYNQTSSDTSSSDRSDDWIDMSDQDENGEDPTIIIIREKSRGKRSPASWSRKVRDQWNKSPKKPEISVFVSSPSVVYISTSNIATFYSDNDEIYSSLRTYQNTDVIFRFVTSNQLRHKDLIGLAVLKLVNTDDDSLETQEANILIDTDSSDKEHFYESLSHPLNLAETQTTSYVDDIDSFDSDSESEEQSFQLISKNDVDINHAQLPDPPISSNNYTLTRFASAAGKKMKQLKSNFTKSTRKKSTDNTDKNVTTSINGEKDPKPSLDKKNKKLSLKDNLKNTSDTSQNPTFVVSKSEGVNEDKNKLEKENTNNNRQSSLFYDNINPSQQMRDSKVTNKSLLNLELMNALTDRKMKFNNSNESVDSMNNNKTDISVSPVSNHSTSPLIENKSDKEMNTLSRKSYLSFKSKFKRNSSLIENNPSRSLSLSITKSTFYLDDLNDSSMHKSESQLVKTAEESPPIAPFRKSNKKNGLENVPKDLKLLLNVPNSPSPTKTSPVNENKSNFSTKFNKTRPSGPPPPPPVDNTIDSRKSSINKKDKRNTNVTSWYAEYSLFKANDQSKPETNGHVGERKSSALWYSEVGLYQVGNISTSSGASSTVSGGGTCSTTTAPSPPDTPVPPLGMFKEEPLYQFYNEAKLQSFRRELDKDIDMDSDTYEKILYFKEENKNDKLIHRPSAMALINPQKGPSRTLWCEISEVINSGILDTLTPTQKKLQEAMFEIVTSEASYLNSLTVLETHFMFHPAFQDNKILSDSDHNILFGNIIPVKQCSEQLMADLEQCWQENILLRGLCETVKNHAAKNFHVYVKFCKCQIFLVKALKKLKQDNKFNEILQQIQSKPACHSLSFHSFLMLPMQRVTRLPLLMDAVLKNMDVSNEEYQPCLDALATLSNVVSQCNEGARNMERIEEIIELSSKIDFPPHIKEIPISAMKTDVCSVTDTPQRWLVRSGELTHLLWRGEDQSKLTFGKKINKIPLYLFLFTDLLIITKKKSEESFVVVDYCKRSLLEVTSNDLMAQSPMKEVAGKNVLLLTLLENCENKTIEMLLSCASESDRQRWIEACLPPPSENPNETIYEGWDCPQVTAIYSYQPTQPDELNLQEGDIVNVNKKIADGWYHGERIRDGEKGWFPGNYTIEIASQHVRAKNLRQRYRLLALTGSYLGQKKK